MTVFLPSSDLVKLGDINMGIDRVLNNTAGQVGGDSVSHTGGTRAKPGRNKTYGHHHFHYNIHKNCKLLSHAWQASTSHAVSPACKKRRPACQPHPPPPRRQPGGQLVGSRSHCPWQDWRAECRLKRSHSHSRAAAAAERSRPGEGFVLHPVRSSSPPHRDSFMITCGVIPCRQAYFMRHEI